MAGSGFPDPGIQGRTNAIAKTQADTAASSHHTCASAEPLISIPVSDD